MSGGTILQVPPGAKPDARPGPIQYLLGHGGRDPQSAHPGQPAWGPRKWACDCSAFVAWCLGLPKVCKEFPHWSGNICTTSIWEAATKRSGWFDFVEEPIPGDLVVYPNVYGLRSPTANAVAEKIRIGVGHVGIVVAALQMPAPQRGLGWYASRVIHCSSGHQAKLGYAIAEDNASIWQRRGRFVRYLMAETA